MRENDQLSALAESEIEALRDDGVTVTDADVVRLNALAWAVETPESRRLLARGVPVQIGGVVLWPLTLYASEWFDRVGMHLADPGAALAYAMAHGYDAAGALDCEGREAVRRIKRWRRSLRCTHAALEVAIAQVQDQDRMPDMPDDPNGKPMSPGDFSAHMAAVAGGDPEFWERRCAFGYALAVLTAIVAQNRADGESSAHDARINADRALGLEIARIRERHNGAT